MYELLDHLKDLEIALHNPDVRADANKIETLIHPEYAKRCSLWVNEAALWQLKFHQATPVNVD